MPNIPNFNNGDLMKSIRENSLNPAIDKINALDTKVSTLETDSDKSFTDVSTTPDGKIEFTLGDNSKKQITVIPDDPRLDTTTLKNNEIVSWNTADQKFKPTGVLASFGEVRVAPGTILFGNHQMSSSGENVVFTNDDSGKNYTPVWQEQKAGASTAYLRDISPTVVETQLVPVGNADVVNPVILKTTSPKDLIVFGVKFTLVHSAKNVVIEAFDQQGKGIWEELLGDLNSGDHDVDFTAPFETRTGNIYDLKMRSRDGDVVAKGPTAGTNLPMSVTLKTADWSDKELASKDFVNNLFLGTPGKIDPSVAKVAANTSNIAKINNLITKLTNQIKSKTKSYVFRGSVLPKVPTGSRNSYFMTYYNLAGNINMDTPGATTAGDGTLLIIENEDSTYNVQLTATSGKTVDGNSTIVLIPHTVNAFVYNLHNNDWEKIFSGYLPVSYKALYSQVKADLLNDKKFLTNIKVQGDDPNAVLDCHSLEFKGATVKADPLDAFNGIIDFAGSGGSSVDFSELSDGDIPYFDQGEGKFKDSGVGVSSAGLEMPARGFSLGDTKVAADGQGFTYMPSVGTMPRRVLSQEVNKQNSDLLIKAYSTMEIVNGQSVKTDALTDPNVNLTPTKSAALGGIAIQPAKDIKRLTVTITQARKVIFEDTFFALKSGGERRLRFTTPPDILQGVQYTISFKGTSDDGTASVGLLGLGSEPFIVYSTLPWTEEKVATQKYIDDLLLAISNKLKTDIANVKQNTADIAKANGLIASLGQRIKSKTKSFVYRGSVAPKIPSGSRSDYFLTFYGLSGDVSTTTPMNNVSGDGTLYIVENEDTVHSINITTDTGSTINSGASQKLLPQTTSAFVYNLTNKNWELLFSGYLPTSYKNLYSQVKTDLVNDHKFMTGLDLQGEGSSEVLGCKTVEVKGATVNVDPNDSTKGVIDLGAGGEITFINPDASIHKGNTIKLVGLEVKDPGNGSPLKLYALNHQNLPKPAEADAYAFYDANPTAPDKLAFQSLPLFRGGRVTIHKNVADPQYAYIILPPGQVEPTEKIGELGGLPAYWSKESKNYPVNGVDRIYTVFRSPYPFHERDITLILYP